MCTHSYEIGAPSSLEFPSVSAFLSLLNKRLILLFAPIPCTQLHLGWKGELKPSSAPALRPLCFSRATSPAWEQLSSSFIRLPILHTALVQERPGPIARLLWPMINNFLVCVSHRQELGANLRVDLVSKPKSGLGGMECLPCPDSSSQQLEQGWFDAVLLWKVLSGGRRRLQGWQELAPLRGDMVGVAQQHQVSLPRGTLLRLIAAVVVFPWSSYSHFCLLGAKC